jgi:DNA-binding CsgD family transcriptional regulator
MASALDAERMILLDSPEDRKRDAFAGERAARARLVKSPPLLDANVAILDDKGIIVAVNDAWRKFGRRNGLRMQNDGIGAAYFAEPARGDAQTIHRKLIAIGRGQLDFLCVFYPCHSKWTKRWFALVAVPVRTRQQGRVAVLHVNVTPLLKGTRRNAVGTASRNPPALDDPRIRAAVERTIIKVLAEQVVALGQIENGNVPGTGAGMQDRVSSLSGAQWNVFRLLGAGKSNKQIAYALGRSPNTIKLHVSTILRKLNLQRRAEAAVLSAGLSRHSRARRPS